MGIEIIADAIGKAVKALFGSRNERLVRDYHERVAAVTALEGEFQALSDDALLAVTADLRRRHGEGEALADLLPQAFAAVREAAKRTIYLGYAEAPADYHPEIQDLIRKAMRGEASLIDPASGGGRTVDLHGLYGMRPYDVQLVAGMALNDGRISELATGEGKTLVASLAAYLNAIAGPVHVVSVNDYLVRRDCEWNRPIFRRLGLTVGAIQANMDNADRQREYACNITYGTNNEFGFDYLRDNMKTSRAEQVQGELVYAIVDECDSVLIDEARTPLIISGPAFESTEKYAKAEEVSRKLRPPRPGREQDDPEADFHIKEKEHQCPLTEKGVRRAEELVGVGSFYVAGNMDWPHLIDQALRAQHLYFLDKQYVVRDGEVVIVDEFTGRLMPGRQWSEGLHQAVEAKEARNPHRPPVKIKEETQTLATITIQNFFRMYKKLGGMTGTAMTEAAEFDKIYTLETVSIPTNRPLSRIEHADTIYRTRKEKWDALVDEIKSYHDRGRPVLVGTTSIQNSELLSTILSRRYGIPHEVLNAKFHAKEAEIVAKAGQRYVGPDGKERGNVTIATNMAGRGTDIKLGAGVVWPNCFGPWDLQKQVIPSDFGNKCCVGCKEYNPKTNCAHCFKPKIDPDFPARGKTECVANPPCGLHVVGTERHEARRIDNQLRGRTGRQGDPGSSRFFLSLEDDLMRIFARDWVSGALQKLGMEEGMALEHRWLSRGIENAQKKVEERNFDIRKHLLEYDEVMDQQRKIFYGRRQNILESGDLGDFVWEFLTESVEAACDSYLSENYSYETVAEWAGRTLGAPVEVAQVQGKDADDLIEFLQTHAEQAARDSIDETLGEFLPDDGEDTGEDLGDGEPDEEADEGPEPAAQADYRGLAAWAQARVGVRLKESDLKKMSAEEIREMLHKAAVDQIAAIDLAPIQEFLKPEFRLAALANWAGKKFEFDLHPADFAGKDRDAAVAMLIERLRALYAEKERSYPIEFAIEEHLTPQVGAGSQDFDGLAAWASRHYLTGVTADALRSRDPREVRSKLIEIAREFEASDRLRLTVQGGVRLHAAPGDPASEASWSMMAEWARASLGLEITPREFVQAWTGEAEMPLYPSRDHQGADDASDDESATATGAGPSEESAPAPAAVPTGEDGVIALVLQRARRDRHARMTDLERYLLLQVHDTSWKDHLLVMDHLKSGVGLRGYAQLNPLIEFKKEGLESFERMLETTREKFTDLFFKARWVRQEALARIWAGQSSEHAVAASAYEAQQRAALQAHQQAQMAQEGESIVKPIVRDAPKVGRNDPCTCGSGKKYKKCCGKNA